MCFTQASFSLIVISIGFGRCMSTITKQHTSKTIRPKMLPHLSKNLVDDTVSCLASTTSAPATSLHESLMFRNYKHLKKLTIPSVNH